MQHFTSTTFICCNLCYNRNVVEILGAINDKRVVEPLIEALDDENEEVQRNAAEALHEMTGENFGICSSEW